MRKNNVADPVRLGWTKKADEARRMSQVPEHTATENLRFDQKWRCYRLCAEGGNISAALDSARLALTDPENLRGTYEVRLMAMVEVYEGYLGLAPSA